MKKLLIGLCLLPALLTSVQANSGPAFIQANPGLEIAVDVGCPIAVEHENLTFDFSDGGWGAWSPEADVTAAYTMVNPSNEDVSVTMAFPFVTSFSASNTGLHSISVDGKAIEYDLYYGKQVSNDAVLLDLNLNDILSNVLVKAPAEPEDGLIYTVNLDTSALSSDTERIFVRMKLELRSDVCYTVGNTLISDNGDRTAEIGTWVYLNRSDKPMTVFVPGGSLKSYSVSAFESHDSDVPLSLVIPDVGLKSSGFREYMESCLLQENGGGLRQEIDERVYWALLQKITENPPVGVVSAYDLMSSVNVSDRLAMAVYTVDFFKGETKRVTVECALNGTMDRPSAGYSMKNATFTYTYLSNPAKEWADFGLLSLTVVPPEDMILISSIPELNRDEYGRFKAEQGGLPENNIRLVLGYEREPEPPKGFGSSSWIAYLLVFIAVSLIVLMIILRRSRNKRSIR